MATEYQVIHLRANNDVNGNPRRCFLVFRDNRCVVAIDEGYSGEGALSDARNYPDGMGPGEGDVFHILARIDTTPKERREWLRTHGKGGTAR